MFIHAFITPIGANPEPTIFLVLDGLDEVLADLVGRRSRVPLLAKDDLAQLLLIPVLHSILLLLFLFAGLRIAGIGVEILLSGLPLDVQIMAELALLPFFAVALLVEDTDDGLGIHTERNLLSLEGLEQLCCLLLRIFFGLLLSGTTGLLRLFPLVIWCLVG